MLEDILLLKKIVDYFKKINKPEIAKMVNAELQKEVEYYPDFHEPDYVKEDLEVIFTKHVRVQRRKSESHQRLLSMSNSRTTNMREQVRAKRSNAARRQSFLINPVNMSIEENNDNINIEDVSDTECQINPLINRETEEIINVVNASDEINQSGIADNRETINLEDMPNEIRQRNQSINHENEENINIESTSNENNERNKSVRNVNPEQINMENKSEEIHQGNQSINQENMNTNVRSNVDQINPLINIENNRNIDSVNTPNENNQRNHIENQENINMENVQNETRHRNLFDMDSSILAPLVNNRLSEGMANKSQFLPGIISTPYAIHRGEEKDDVKLEEDVEEPNNEDGFSDDSSLIFLETDDTFQQTIYNTPSILDNYIESIDMNQIIEDYERIVIKSSQLTQPNTQINKQRVDSFGSSPDFTESDQINNDNDQGYSQFHHENQFELIDSQDVQINVKNSQHSPQQISFDTSQQPDQDLNFSFQDAEEIPFPFAQVCESSNNLSNVSNNQLEMNTDLDHQNNNDEEIVEKAIEPLVKETHEISIQCDPNDFIDIESIESPKKSNKKRTFDESIDKENERNNKRRKVEECEIIDLENLPIRKKQTTLEVAECNIIDLEDEENNRIPTTNCNEVSEIIDLDDIDDNQEEDLFPTQITFVGTNNQPRSRESSLSSLDDEPNLPSQTKDSKVKRKITVKTFLPFKDDKKLDLQRRVLLADGWILWPTSLLSGCLKNYDVPALLEVLGITEESTEMKESVKRKLLIDKCLKEMSKEKLIHQCFCKSKKLCFYIKFASLSEESLQLYEISEQIYTDSLWFKNLGPKTGRKLCADLAPKVVKDLLNVELTYIGTLLETP